VVSLFSIKLFTGSNSLFVKLVSHGLFKFKENSEKIFTEISQIFLFKKLRVNLRKTIKFRVNLILRDRALVSDQVLKL
jgi:hypothetical protein